MCSKALLNFVVLANTENRNRTGAAVRHVFTKTGGELQKTGANDFMFRERGEVIFDVGSGDDEDLEDEVTMAALEGGAEDVKFEADDDTKKAIVDCDVPALSDVGAAGLVVLVVNVEDGFRLRQAQKIIVALEAIGSDKVLEALATVILFGELALLNHCPHSSVKHHDALLHCLVEVSKYVALPEDILFVAPMRV